MCSGSRVLKRIFVSSTFRDFQQERDWLRNSVQALLNVEAKKYGDYVQFSDLRWGIDTSECDDEEATNKIVKVCLDEIDRSMPYMIILLGDVYGTTIEKDVIDQLLQERKDNFKQYLELLEISVTQLEIEYSLYKSRDNLSRIFVYIREYSDAKVIDDFDEKQRSEIEKVNEIKKRLSRLEGINIRTYIADDLVDASNCKNRFVELVSADLLESLKEEWESYACLSPCEKEAIFQWNLVEKNNRTKKTTIKEWDDYIEGERGIIKVLDHGDNAGVEGTHPMNREMIFASDCKKLVEKGIDVIPFYCGKREKKESVDDILVYIKGRLKRMLDIEQSKEISLDELFSLRESVGKKLVIAICGFENISDIYENYSNLFTKEGSPNIRYYLYGFLDTKHELYTNLKSYGLKTMIMRKERRGWAQNLLQFYGKELSQETIDLLEEKTRDWNFYFRMMAVNMLNLIGKEDFNIIRKNGNGMKEIKEYQEHIIRNVLPEKSVRSVKAYIDMLIQQYDAEWMLIAMKYIMISKAGLRVSDIESLIRKDGYKFDYLTFVQVINSLEYVFAENEQGYYYFYDSYAKQTFFREITSKEIWKYRMSLHSYVQELPEEDELKTQEDELKRAIYTQFFYRKIIEVETNKEKSEDTKEKLIKMLDENGIEFIKELITGLKDYEGYKENCWEIMAIVLFFFRYFIERDVLTVKNQDTYVYMLEKITNFLMKVEKNHDDLLLNRYCLEYTFLTSLTNESIEKYGQAYGYYTMSMIYLEQNQNVLKKEGVYQEYENSLRRTYERIEPYVNEIFEKAKEG